MKFRSFKRWGIAGQLTLVSVVPTIFIAIVLTSYHMQVRSVAEDENLHAYGLAVTRNAAIIAELGLISANETALAEAASSIASQDNVYGVRFLDKQRAEILSFPDSVNNLKLALPNNVVDVVANELSADLVLFNIAVRPSKIDYSDHEESFTGDTQGMLVDPLLGWVQVVVDNSSATGKQNKSRADAFFIAFLGLLIAFLLAQYATRVFTRRIEKMRDAVKGISEGGYPEPTAEPENDELGELQTGLNHMAVMLEDSQLTLRAKVIQATSKLQETLEELERRNQDLEEATELAESASLAKDEFLARMSHELRTPLTSISGFVDLLKKSKLDDEQSEYLGIVSQASQLLLATVNDILDLSELSQSNLTLSPSEFELISALDNMIAMHESAAFKKGIELIVDVEQAVPRIVKADRMRLMQICNNLVSNAVKFTDVGYVLVSVSLEEHGEQNDILNLTIKDSGPGIESAHLGNLFEPFYQGDTSIKRRYGGTGLGLMIAKGVAEEMGGGLTIESTVGQGTEAILIVPVEPIADDTLSSGSLDSKIFIIHDSNPWSRRSIRARLLLHSSQVFITSNEDKLLSLLSRWDAEQPCVLLSFSASESTLESVERALAKLAPHFNGHLILLLSSSHLPPTSKLSLLEHFLGVQQLRKPLRNEQFYAALTNVTGTPLQPGSTSLTTPTAKSEQTELAGKRILVVEDNAYNRKLLQAVLDELDIEVETAANGKLGLQALQTRQFDLALVDLHMPEMDGIALARLANMNTIVCPIILMTADLFALRDEIVGEFGIVERLQKPLDQSLFTQALHQFLGNGSEDPIRLSAITHHTEPSRSQLLQLEPQLLNKEIARLAIEINAVLQPFEADTALKLAHELKGLTGLAANAQTTAVCEQIHAAAADGKPRAIAALLTQLENPE